jgi:replicative DNA helicase
MADAEYRVSLERAVLGVLVWDARAVLRTQAVLGDEAFADPRHRAIWEICCALREGGRSLDPTVVAMELTRIGRIGEAGGAEYVGSLVADPRHLDENVGKLREEVKRVQIERTMAAVGRLAVDRSVPVTEVLTEALRQLDTIELDDPEAELRPISDAVAEILSELESGVDPGTPTGFASLDLAIQGGIKPSQMVVVAGSTGSGKTALGSLIALRAAQWAAADQRRGDILFFSYEMSQKELAIRMLLQATPQIRFGYHPPAGFAEVDKPAVRAAVEHIARLPIRIEERAGETVGAVRAAVERNIQRAGGRKPSLVIVDHIGLLSAPKTTNRAEAVGQITRGLKNMARLLDIPVLALAQLNREVGKREDHKPQLSDLRESGTIEQDSNIVLLIHRPSYYHDAEVRVTEEAAGAEAFIYVAKNRSGPTATIPMIWFGPLATFSEVPGAGVGLPSTPGALPPDSGLPANELGSIMSGMVDNPEDTGLDEEEDAVFG